jgi:hypothetical protein
LNGVHPAVQEWTTNSSIEELFSLLSSENFDRVTQAMKTLVMNTESGRKWSALFNAEVEDMQKNNSAVTPSESVPAPPVATGLTAVEEEPLPLSILEDANLNLPFDVSRFIFLFILFTNVLLLGFLQVVSRVGDNINVDVIGGFEELVNSIAAADSNTSTHQP